MASSLVKSGRSQNHIQTLKDAMSSKTPKHVEHKLARWVPTRGDARFPVQHYVFVFTRENSGKFKGDVMQLRPDGIQASYILKAHIANAECAIDEVKGKLYLIKTFITYAKLEMLSICQAQADKAGFRRTSLSQSSTDSFKFIYGFDNKVLAPLFILPDGNLVWWILMDRANVSKPEKDTLRHRMAAITTDKQKVSMLPNHIFEMSHYPLHEFAFLKQNTQLVVHCHPQNFTPRRMDRSQFVVFDIEYGESFKVIGPIDRLQPCTNDILERPFLQFKDVFDKKAQLIGRGYKYWLIGFAKDTSQKLLAVRSKHVSLDCLKDKQPKQAIWAVQESAEYKAAMNKLMFDLMGKDVELINAWVNKGMYHAQFGVGTHSRLLISVPLPLGFKDYRVCANCKVLENGKRKNSKGKRTADFKVCRICKSLNLHLRWWKFGCHFCSKQCIDQAWKTHVKMHQML